MNTLSCVLSTDKNSRQTNLNSMLGFPLSVYSHHFDNHSIECHWHEEVEIIVVLAGKLELAIEMQKIVLNAGESIFINSGILHSCTQYMDENCIIHSFVFQARIVYGDTDSLFYRKYFKSLFSETGIPFIVLEDELSTNLQELYEKLTNEDFAKEFAYEFKVRESLSNILLSISTHNENMPIVSYNKKARTLNRYKAMAQFIHQNYNQNISLTDIANSAHIKKSECLRCFKNVIATSPIQYLKKFRLEQAALLLITSTKPIIEVTLDCGFLDVSYFSKSFKELFCLTPKEYRKLKNYEKKS